MWGIYRSFLFVTFSIIRVLEIIIIIIVVVVVVVVVVSETNTDVAMLDALATAHNTITPCVINAWPYRPPLISCQHILTSTPLIICQTAWTHIRLV